MATPSFWSLLWSQPAGPHSKLSRYVVANGYLYLAIGAGMYALPASALKAMFMLDHFAGMEEGLARIAGATVAVIGWFYVMGGRTRATSFGLSTVVDRLLIPALLLPLWWLDLAPLTVVLPFSVLDPALGIGAFFIWRGER